MKSDSPLLDDIQEKTTREGVLPLTTFHHFEQASPRVGCNHRSFRLEVENKTIPPVT